MDDLFCCYIPESGPDCANYALYELRWGPTPDDYTHSCGRHLNEMVDAEISDAEVTVSLVST